MTDAVTTLPPVDGDLRRRLAKASQTAVRSTKQRDQLIAEAYRQGASMREIGRLIGMTHPGVRSILIRDGVYDPQPRRGRHRVSGVTNLPREHT